jgi:DNA-binding IclR family transcriptional regulator
LTTVAAMGARTPGGQEPRAVQRALLLLEAVARLGPGTTARAVADYAEVPPGTAYRLLNLLVGDGYLVRIDGLTGFALGRRAQELAGQVGVTGPVEVGEVVETLRVGIRHGVHVIDLTGPAPCWADRDPDHEVGADDQMLAATHSSAVGKLVLAARPELLTGGPLPRLTPYTVTQWPTLLEQLTDVRGSGLAVDREETVLGRVAVAGAITAGGQRLTGCILVTGRRGRLDPDEPAVTRPVLAAARRLTGWSGVSRSRALPR